MNLFNRITDSYDLGMLPLEIALLQSLRRGLYPKLRGQVLELGTGTGRNLPFYDPSVRLVASDLNAQMLAAAQCRPTQTEISWLQIDAQHLPFEDASFDVVATSLLFCCIADPMTALGEIKRVLRPGGRLVSLEHVRGHAGLGRYLTDVLAGPWLSLNGTCHLNRETAQIISKAGLQIISSHRHGLGIFQVIEARSH